MAESKRDVNILLLGETGVGQSTFVNSFANYVQYETFEIARTSKVQCLIPTRFTMFDEKLQESHVTIGNDKNEHQNFGKATTQGIKSNVFSMEGDDRNIRLINTPGIGDPRGIAQDHNIFESIVDYISQGVYLHAICFLLKPNVDVIHPCFKFCLQHLLMRLGNSVAQNIIFVFTNTRSTFYRPDKTLMNIRRILQEVQSQPPHVKIPCDTGNIFCMDNEAFRFLAAVEDGVRFSYEEIENYSASWEVSVKTCKRLIDYVAGDKLSSMKSHSIENALRTDSTSIFVDSTKDHKIKSIPVWKDTSKDTKSLLCLETLPEVIKTLNASNENKMKLSQIKVSDNNSDKIMLNYMSDAIKTESKDTIRNLFPHIKDNTPLYMAIISGKLEIAEYLISLGADPRRVDKNGTTCIHYASKKGNLKIIKYFIQHTPNVNVKNNFGTTPLHYAVQGQLEAVKFLIEKGANLSSLDYDESSCLYYAASSGKTDIIQYLISQKSDVNAENYFGFTPLLIAVATGNLDAVKCLVKNGANPMCIDDNGLSCLHFAAEKGFLEIIKYLLSIINDVDIDVDIRSHLGETPLHYAVRNNLEVVHFLISEKRADPTLKDHGGFSCMHYASKAGNIEIIGYLIQRRLDINVTNNLGATPLHYSVYGNLDTVKFLVKNEANLKDTDINHSNCVHYAAKSGNVEIMKFLIKENHSHINMKNCFGLTPLHVAVENGNLDIIKLLIDNGANSKIEDIKGLTCIEYANKLGCEDIIQYLNHLYSYSLEELVPTASANWKVREGSTPPIRFRRLLNICSRIIIMIFFAIFSAFLFLYLYFPMELER